MTNQYDVYKVDTINNHLQDLQNTTITQEQPGNSGQLNVTALVKMINSGDLSEHEAKNAIRELRDKAIKTLDKISYDPENLFEQAELLTNLAQLEKTATVAKAALEEKYGNTLHHVVVEFEESFFVVNPRLNLAASLTILFEEEYSELSVLDAVTEKIVQLRSNIDECLESKFQEMEEPPSEELKEHIRAIFLPADIVSREDVSRWITNYQQLSGGLQGESNGLTSSVGAGIQVALRMAGGLENAGITGYAPTKAVLNTLRLMFLNGELDILNNCDFNSHYRSQEVEKAQHERLRDIYQHLAELDPTHKESYDIIARSLTGMCPSSRALMCQVASTIFPSWLM